jgi:ADP-heptose:LPS heptosyltransferase
VPLLPSLSSQEQQRFTTMVPVATIDTLAREIVNCDLVISVDTMAAHLAGALDVPTWTLLKFSADWRWLLDRADSPWYPSMRLYRQPWPGAWTEVLEAVGASLASTGW